MVVISDDGNERDSPPLVETNVKLEVTPSTDTSSESSGVGQKRRRPQPHQGDYILIHFLADQNQPDVATRAGEEALPASDEEDQYAHMADVDTQPRNPQRSGTGSPREKVSPPSTRISPNSHEGVRMRSPLGRDGRPVRPTIIIEPSSSSSQLQSSSRNLTPPRPRIPSVEISHDGRPEVDYRLSRAATDGYPGIRRTDYDRQYERSRSRSPDRSSRNDWAQPMSRSSTVPITTFPSSSAIALPPLQPQLSAGSSVKSPSLPSLAQSNLKEMLDPQQPPPNLQVNDSRRSPGLLPGSLNSPPIGSRRPSRTSPPAHLSPPQAPIHSHGQLSPLPSEPSPRSALPGGDRLGSARLPSKVSTQSELLTPQSAISYPGSSAFSTAGSPHRNDQPSEAERFSRQLPPLIAQSGATAQPTGSYKCDYDGCNAAPFSTQYLLK